MLDGLTAFKESSKKLKQTIDEILENQSEKLTKKKRAKLISRVLDIIELENRWYNKLKAFIVKSYTPLMYQKNIYDWWHAIDQLLEKRLPEEILPAEIVDKLCEQALHFQQVILPDLQANLISQLHHEKRKIAISRQKRLNQLKEIFITIPILFLLYIGGSVALWHFLPTLLNALLNLTLWLYFQGLIVSLLFQFNHYMYFASSCSLNLILPCILLMRMMTKNKIIQIIATSLICISILYFMPMLIFLPMFSYLSALAWRYVIRPTFQILSDVQGINDSINHWLWDTAKPKINLEPINDQVQQLLDLSERQDFFDTLQLNPFQRQLYHSLDEQKREIILALSKYRNKTQHQEMKRYLNALLCSHSQEIPDVIKQKIGCLKEQAKKTTSTSLSASEHQQLDALLESLQSLQSHYFVALSNSAAYCQESHEKRSALNTLSRHLERNPKPQSLKGVFDVLQQNNLGQVEAEDLTALKNTLSRYQEHRFFSAEVRRMLNGSRDRIEPTEAINSKKT